MPVISGSLVNDIVAVTFVFLASVYLYFRFFLYNYWEKRGVACIEPTVPIGNFGPIFKGKICIGEIWSEGYNKFKRNRYFGMYAFHRPYLVLTDPELIKHVIVKEFNHFHDRGGYCNEKIDPLTGTLPQLRGQKWRKARSKLSQTFTAGKVKYMFGIMAKLGHKLALYLKPKAEKRELVEVKDLFDRLGTDVTMTTAFGIKCNSLENPNDAQFIYWGKKILDTGAIWTLFSLFGERIMHLFSIPFTDSSTTKFFVNLFRDTVEYREKNNVKTPDFMNLLMQLMKRGYVDPNDEGTTKSISDVPNGKLTFLEGAAHATIFFVAGFESTSSLVAYCLYELAQNQDIQEKVRKDIDSSLEKFGGLTYESIREMKYLQKVVSETLRKYPPLPFLKRVCTKDIELPSTNLRINKGLEVIVPLLSIQRDPEIYPHPDKFDPERFSEENIATRHPFAYLPFGGGPRICIGMRFAEVQSKVALVSTLEKYRVKLAPSTPVPLNFAPISFNLSVKGGIVLAFEPR